MYTTNIQCRASIIEVIRETRYFLKTACALTSFFFLFTFYSPNALAIKEAIEQKASQTLKIKGDTDEAKLTHVLQTIKERVTEKKRTIGERVQKESDILDAVLNFFGLSALQTESISDMVALNKEVQQLNEKALASFAVIEKNLKTKNLPPEILQRHYDVMEKYKAEFGNLQSRIQQLEIAKSLRDQQGAVDALDTFLQGQQFKRSQQPFDPNNLPFGTPDANVREPLTDKNQLSQLIDGNEAPPLAERILDSMIKPTYAQPPAQPMPTDLTETIDVQFTQAIKDLAQQLNYDPIEIYTWVHNNIRFIPSYGSIQGSDMTLQTKQGNAFDTASLLIALLRASNIPARYAYGTISMPAEQAMNWVGGVDKPEVAQQLLGQGGIPNIAETKAGKIVAIKLEHTWVEAWVDFEPSRGVKNIQGDSWVPMDAGFKQYDYQAGMNLQNEVPFDAQGLVAALLTSATEDQAQGWVQGLSKTAIETSLTNHEQALKDYFTRLNIDASVGNALGTQRISVKSPAPLSAGLPYSLVTSVNTYSEIPDNLRHKLRYTLQRSDGGGFYGLSSKSDVFSYLISLPAIAGKAISVSFKPATQQDENTLLSFLPASSSGQPLTLADIPKSIPGYLIKVIAEFNVEGQALITQGQFSIGDEISHKVDLFNPKSGWKSRDATGIAGEYRAIGLDLQGFSLEQLRKARLAYEAIELKIKNGDMTGVNRHSVIGAITQLNIFNYFALNDIINSIESQSAGIVEYRAPSFGFFHTDLSPQYFFGIPRSVKAPGVTMDVPLLQTQSYAKNNDQQAWIIYNRAKGMRASYLENWIPEKFFSTQAHPTEGVSAAKALALANQQGQKIYRLTRANATALSNISINAEDRRDIQSALNAGKDVTVHEAPITINGWSGSGYVIMDPDTGAGAYLISGGANGGYLLLIAGVLIAILAILSANPITGLFLLVLSLWVIGCALSMITGDDRYFDIYSLIAVGIIAGLLEAASAGMATAIIPMIIEALVILGNYDDACAAGF